MDSPVTGIQRSRPRSHRKPLQPRNSPAEPPSRSPLKPKPAPTSFRIVSPADEAAAADKENRLPGSAVQGLAAAICPMDTSLAEELGAVRRRRERLRAERERTEEMLVERERMLDRAMREVERRWEEQRRVELELRRLIRLQELGSPCARFSPIQSLREREEENRKKDAQSQRSSPIQSLSEREEEKKKDAQSLREREGKKKDAQSLGEREEEEKKDVQSLREREEEKKKKDAQSLREREEEKKKKDAQSQVIKKEETQTAVIENVDAESSRRKEAENTEFGGRKCTEQQVIDRLLELGP